MYSAVLGRWIQQDPAGYVDGSNLFQTETSNPTDAVDPQGEDRYLVNNGPHFGLEVDTWELADGHWVNTGRRRFDFSLSKNPWLCVINGVGALTFSASGQVTENEPNDDDDNGRITSSPAADNRLLAQLEAERIKPPNYHLIFNNCNDWALSRRYVGMSADEIRKDFEANVKSIPLP